jgi:hypothetical protein
MPNGKGSLECCYCDYWRGERQGYDGAYEEGFCSYFKSRLPSTSESWTHRICTKFEPNSFYNKDSPTISPEERFGWFRKKLKDGVLYGFSYNKPDSIEELKKLSDEVT